MQVEIKAAEAATLMGCTVQNIRAKISRNSLPAAARINERNRPEYWIPLSALPADVQRKYYKQHGITELLYREPERAAEAPAKALDEFTETERSEIDFWTQTVKTWLAYRNKSGTATKAQIDERFVCAMQLEHPEIAISKDILYRKWAAVRKGDMEALVDKRGKCRKEKSGVDPDVAAIFCAFYLEETKQPNMQEAIRSTEDYFEEYDASKLPLPSYSTFRRIALDIPEAVRSRGIMGKKHFDDNYGLYIKRVYDKLHSNDVWVTDNHTFDVSTIGANGKPHRLYLTAFMDVRSGIMASWYVTDAPCSQATIYALRRGIVKHGMPVKILADNGREFLTYDVGGRGHRAKKVLANGQAPFEPPTILQRLGIEFSVALVKNAKAKPIERRFLDVKGQFSRLWESFTGGNVVEKPECLKAVMKSGDKLPTDAEFIKAVDTLIEGYFNVQPYNGAVKSDHGKRKIDVYNEHLESVRKPVDMVSGTTNISRSNKATFREMIFTR